MLPVPPANFIQKALMPLENYVSYPKFQSIKNKPGLLHICFAVVRQLSDQISKRSLISLGDVDRLLVKFSEHRWIHVNI